MKPSANDLLLKNQRGQAVFEMIIFLPFLVFLYSMYYTVGNSISGSINQQKAVRAYFYNLTKGNSYLNTRLDLAQYKSTNNLVTIGFSSLGWREKTSGDGSTAFAPCFKFSSLLKNTSTEECDSSEREEEGSSRFIRVFTYYGVCGPVYTLPQEGGDFFEIVPQNQNNPNYCSLSTSPPS